MQNFENKYTLHDDYLEVSCLGVWLTKEDVFSYTFEIVKQAERVDKDLLLLDQNLLYMSLTDVEIAAYMKSLEVNLSNSFDFHFIALISLDGGREQKFFEKLSKSNGFKFEVYSDRENALQRIKEIKKVS